MAKKTQPDLSNIFARTDPGRATPPADNSDLDEGAVRATGVGLHEGELRALDAICAELGELLDTEPPARNALLRALARRMIVDLRAGRLSLQDLAANFQKPRKAKPRLRMP
jgi:hypothetical protein